MLLCRNGKGRHSGIVCKASAQGHPVILWKAKAEGNLIGQCIIDYDSCMYCITFCRYVVRDTEEERCVLPLTHARASGPIAPHKVYNNIVYSLEYYCLLYVYMLIYTQVDDRHSGIVCNASAQGSLSLSGRQRGRALRLVNA